jgi:hypothetical protein
MFLETLTSLQWNCSTGIFDINYYSGSMLNFCLGLDSDPHPLTYSSFGTQDYRCNTTPGFLLEMGSC